jgi:LDH2 family malate/lactate/ureidoglycolate dehydrogenase
MSKRTAEGEKKEETVMVPLAEANKKVKEALMKCGWNSEAAGIQADIMVAAETCGNNQA